ncbi:MAG: chromosomal replication initiator protein DnaA [Clostridia bacterium]|nr:chromosomal replication initiator protein DnaA [Clostridia bacterium]MBQ6708153.1 chromosomal replication initiator protein DnaA [Clostridia bacterium]
MDNNYDSRFFENLWQMVLEDCRKSLSETAFNVWFNDLKLVSFEDSKVVLSVAQFKQKIIVTKFFNIINGAFEKVLGFPIEIEFVTPEDPKNVTMRFNGNDKTQMFTAKNMENTFDTFVVGNSNRFAHAASQAVAATPGRAYNPLFIYGNSGLGKTHLLSAINHEIRNSYPDLDIIYTHGETFANELISYLQNKKDTTVFHNKYRGTDVLLVDDIQFIEGKDSTQEEFFHTFDTLINQGKQIVITSDRPPKKMNQLDDRLKTRFERGLIADVQPPDLETRTAIIKRKAEFLNLEMSHEIAVYIAERLKTNIRQLEGAVNKIQAYVVIDNAPMNLKTAQLAIKDIYNDESLPAPAVIKRIIEEVVRMTGETTVDDVRSKKKDAATSRARQLAIYIAREVTQLPLKAIGEEFGGRNHTTVLYAINEIKDELKRHPNLQTEIDEIIKNVKEN